jgi:hypothetical protein
MQIHEITKRGLAEGILKTIGQDIKGAVTEPFQKLQAIANTPGAWTSGLAAGGALDQLERNKINARTAQQTAQVAQQTAQRAKQLAQQWGQIIKTQQKPPPAKDDPVATDPNWRQDALKSAGVKFPQSESKQRSKSKTGNKNPNWRQDALKSVGAAFDPPPVPRPAPGQMPASVAASRQGKLMLQAYGKPKGGIQDIDEAPQEYTTPSGIVVPGGVKSDQATAPVNDDQFVKWSDQQLDSVIPGTRQPITMSMVRQDTELSQAVSDALNKVVKSNNDLRAVEEYFVVAMQAMQRLSAKLKQSTAQSRVSPTAAAAGAELLTQFISNSQLQDIKDIARNPAVAQKIKNELGIR